MSYGDIEAVSNKENVECKVIEKIIEVRTVVPDNLCNTCFQSCFSTAFSSIKDYAYSANTVLQSYAPYIVTFAAGSLIATIASNKQYVVKSSKAIMTMLFAGFNAKAEMDHEKINYQPFKEINPSFAKGLDTSYHHIVDEIPVKTFIAATEYKSESSFSNSPTDNVDNVFMQLSNEDINLEYDH